ncbi:Reprolysin family propeptide [Popillia japonica]|uniref:Reprolysin family propeptide n=1 Tax=Popillia japonica TaxID=7064 RepID=A0AAW1N3Z0_POPJA
MPLGQLWLQLAVCLSIAVRNSLPSNTFYRGLYTNRIEEAQITVPKKVTISGEHISDDVTSCHDDGPVHFNPKKVTISGEHISDDVTSCHDDGPVHFNVTISNKEHLLVVQPVKHFLAPGLLIERHKRDVHVRLKPKKESIECHYQGHVHGELNSRVAISACNGLAGLIHTTNEKYFIEPHYHEMRKIRAGHRHLVFKRSTVSGNSPGKRKRKKKKRRHIQNCGTREPKRMTELEWQRQIGKVRVQEKKHKHKHKIVFDTVKHSNLKKHKYRKLRRASENRGVKRKRSVSKPRFVETLLVADNSMIEFHDNDGIETYLLTIMNMVSSLYTDPSIGNFIKVSVVRIILIDDPLSKPELNVTTNADVTLKNFCKWQKNLNPYNDSHPQHHDVAVLVTRKDICARKNIPCNTLGVAHVGGMCNSDKSCSVNEDNGITLAHNV